MRKKRIWLVPFVVAPIVGLAAVPSFGGETPAPHESVLATVNAVRQNDLHSLLRNLLTAEQLREAESDWNTQRREPVDPEQDMQFQMFMAMLTGPGAEENLMAMVEPKLEEMRPQVTMMVGMFSGMAQAGLQQDQTLDADDKERAARLIDQMSRLLLENDITDPKSARLSIDILCRGARKLKLASLREVQRLSFTQLLQKGDVCLGVTKDMLAVYGIDLDAWLDSVEAETVSQSGDKAVVRLEYDILGVHESEDVDMVRVDGRWYRKEALELTSAR